MRWRRNWNEKSGLRHQEGRSRAAPLQKEAKHDGDNAKERFCNGLKKEMERPLPRPRQAAMLWSMRSHFRNPVCLPVLNKIYRCKHETFHQLQACRITQAGGD